VIERPCLVGVRLSEDELAHVERLAAMKGQGVSDLLREAVGFVPECDMRTYRPADRHLHLVNST
jgi:Ribbon-helix-helix protein, copG family